jgi:dCMP deaminase
MKSTPTLVLYMPVIHQGYLNFLHQFVDAEIYVLATPIAEQFKPLRKDIRALRAEQIVEALQAWQLGSLVITANEAALRALNQPTQTVILPNEEPMKEVAEQYFPQAKTRFVDVFLRWDGTKTLSHQDLDTFAQVTTDAEDKAYLEIARQQASQSVDQWRQVGAVLVKDGKVLYQNHNHHLPDNYQPAYNGDPRGNFSKGEHIDLATAQHAEAAIVAQAAKEGVSIAGADLYVTTFPCPVCAKLLAETGLSKLFFGEGYAMVDGQKVLESAGISLIKVQ